MCAGDCSPTLAASVKAIPALPACLQFFVEYLALDLIMDQVGGWVDGCASGLAGWVGGAIMERGDG